MNTSAETDYFGDFLGNLNRAVYSISVLAYGLKGEVRKDALAIRGMMKELKKALKGKDAGLKPIQLDELFGAIVIGLSILYFEVEDETKREQVSEIYSILLS